VGSVERVQARISVIVGEPTTCLCALRSGATAHRGRGSNIHGWVCCRSSKTP